MTEAIKDPGVEYPVDQYVTALESIDITELQLDILQIHSDAKDFIDTEVGLAAKLNKLGKRDKDINPAGVHSSRSNFGGKLGKRLGYVPEIRNDGSGIWWRVYCKELEEGPDGLLLQLHLNFVEALCKLDLVHLATAKFDPAELNHDDKATQQHQLDNEIEELTEYDEIKLYEQQAQADNVPETTRKSVIDSRLGQGVFRAKLIEYWGTCSVTGCSTIEILRASHIKPWRNSTPIERLSKYNGLLLIPNLDVLFDKGLISFDLHGKIMISAKLSCADKKLMGVDENMSLRKELEDAHHPFLKFHRQNFGFA